MGYGFVRVIKRVSVQPFLHCPLHYGFGFPPVHWKLEISQILTIQLACTE